MAGGWFDYDNDGRLDLLVVNYAQWSPDTIASAATTMRYPIYCHPRSSRGCRTASIGTAATERSRMCRRVRACWRTSERG